GARHESHPLPRHPTHALVHPVPTRGSSDLAPAAAAPLATRTVLDNGPTLLVAEQPGIPMLVMTILLKTGAAIGIPGRSATSSVRSEEHTSELQSCGHLVCPLP